MSRLWRCWNGRNGRGTSSIRHPRTPWPEPSLFAVTPDLSLSPARPSSWAERVPDPADAGSLDTGSGSGMTGWRDNAHHTSHQPHQNPAREKFAGGLGAVLSSGYDPDLWGTGDRPVVDGRSGLAHITRAPPVRDTCTFRAQVGLLPAKLDASPRRFRFVRLFGNRTPPSPTHARQNGSVRRGRDGSGRRLW